MQIIFSIMCYDSPDRRKHLWCKEAFRLIYILLRPSIRWLANITCGTKWVLVFGWCWQTNSKKLFPETAIIERIAHRPSDNSSDNITVGWAWIGNLFIDLTLSLGVNRISTSNVFKQPTESQLMQINSTYAQQYKEMYLVLASILHCGSIWRSSSGSSIVWFMLYGCMDLYNGLHQNVWPYAELHAALQAQ